MKIIVEQNDAKNNNMKMQLVTNQNSSNITSQQLYNLNSKECNSLSKQLSKNSGTDFLFENKTDNFQKPSLQSPEAKGTKKKHNELLSAFELFASIAPTKTKNVKNEKPIFESQASNLNNSPISLESLRSFLLSFFKCERIWVPRKFNDI